MENQIQPFSFSNQEIRTILTPSNEVFFVANDVCKILDYSNSRDALSRLDEGDVALTDIPDKMGIMQKTNVITESGFYTLVLGSRKPEAKVFKKWVTSEVLPAIRKTGKFEVATTSLSPFDVMQNMLNQLKEQERLQKEQSAKLQTVEQKVALLEQKTQNVNEDYFTVAAWYVPNVKKRYDLTNAEVSAHGKKVTALSTALNYPIIKIADARYSSGIGTYHKDVLKIYFEQKQPNK